MNCAIALSLLSERVSEGTCASFVFLPVGVDAACRIYGVALKAEVTIAFTPTARRWKKGSPVFTSLRFPAALPYAAALKTDPSFPGAYEAQIIVI